MRAGAREAESIAQRRVRCAAGLVALVSLGGCATAGWPPRWPERLAGGEESASLAELLRDRRDAAPPGALVVELAFGARADLDLYVTDPLTETVYFANTPTQSGGVLEHDRTCEDAAPRVETVIFERPLPGRYRVGVDHLRSCNDGKPADFAVAVRAGTRRAEASGALPLGRFDPIVLELDVP
jgi:hypothetical protein